MDNLSPTPHFPDQQSPAKTSPPLSVHTELDKLYADIENTTTTGGTPPDGATRTLGGSTLQNYCIFNLSSYWVNFMFTR